MLAEKIDVTAHLATLATNEVIKLTIKNDCIEIINYFHVAFGE